MRDQLGQVSEQQTQEKLLTTLFRKLRGSKLISVPKVRCQEHFLLLLVFAEQDLRQAALIPISSREN